MDIAFPFGIDRRGRTAERDDEAHIRDLIEQLLFTTPGERVNRPNFGSGLMQLVFAGNSEELAAAVRFAVHGALQQWLGERIQVDDVAAESTDATLRVRIRYTVRRTQERRVAELTRSV